MAIKAGRILHVANNFVVDRIQTGGPGNLNIPQERVNEVGNYETVAIVRDTPELTFSLDSYNVDTELEALLTGSADPSADPAGTKYDLAVTKPFDVVSHFKSPDGAFEGVKGVAIPALTLESASYRFGMKENAGQQFSLRGDSLYYIPGTPYREVFAGTGAQTEFTLAKTALKYASAGANLYVLSVIVDGQRMVPGTDYTSIATKVTFATAPANNAVIAVVYGSATTATFETVHQGVSVKPAAIRGRDLDVYFSTEVTRATVTNKLLDTDVVTLTTGAAHGIGVGETITVSIGDAVFDGTFVTVSGTTGSTVKYAKTHADVLTEAATGTITGAVEVRWSGVQSATVDWKVTLEDDWEFGNKHAVSRDYTDTPDVTGQVELRPADVDALFTKLRQITGVTSGDVIGPDSVVTGALRIVLRNPESGGTTSAAAGATLKTLYVPAAEFTLPGYEARVQQKLATTLSYTSKDGVLEVYKGAMV